MRSPLRSFGKGTGSVLGWMARLIPGTDLARTGRDPVGRKVKYGKPKPPPSDPDQSSPTDD